jgi:hypothetical protein
MTIAKITDAYVRHYSDTNQMKAYVEWIDHKGSVGRTEGAAETDCTPRSTHMAVLFARATREGIETRLERW